MLKPSYAELMEVLNKDTEASSEITSRYTIVIAASKRARQIIDGDSPMVEDTKGKPLSTAVEEINAGKIKVVPEGEGTVLNLHPVVIDDNYLLEEEKHLKEKSEIDSLDKKSDGYTSEIDDEGYGDEDYDEKDYDDDEGDFSDEDYDDYDEEDYIDDEFIKESLEKEVPMESDLEKEVSMKSDLEKEVSMKSDLKKEVSMKNDLEKEVSMKNDLKSKKIVDLESLKKSMLSGK